MQLAESLGFIGGALVTCSMIPQLVRVFQLKSAREISILFTIFFLIGTGFWLAYGIYLSLTPVILWNVTAVILISILLYAKLKYGR